MSEQTTSTGLVVLDRATVSTVLAADENDILGALAKKVAAFRPDISTASGRAAIRSLAHEIATSKTALIRIGKGLTEGWRESTKAVNAECNIIESRMDDLKDQVRAPLTRWENAEKERVRGHEEALASITAGADNARNEPSAQIAERIERLTTLPPRDWQEFTDRAAGVIGIELERLRGLHAAAAQREADAAELARHREAAAERERQEQALAQQRREQEIAAAAAEAARVDAERKAQRADYNRRMLEHVKACGLGFIDNQPQPIVFLQRELTVKIAYTEDNFGDLLPAAIAARDEALVRLQASADAAKRQADAEERAAAELKASEDRAARAEADRLAAIDAARVAAEQADAARKEAERAASESMERAREQAAIEQEAAIARERERVAKETKQKEEEQKKREENIKHRRAINNAAVADLANVVGVQTVEIAQEIVTAIGRGMVANIFIKY